MRVKKFKGRAGLIALGACFNTPDGSGGGGAGAGSPGNAPVLTWSQSVNRCREIESEMTRLSELDAMTDDDKSYFAELESEFTQVDEHRQKLERDAALGRIKSAASKIDARRGSGRNLGAGAPAGVQPGASSELEYDRDAFLEPDSIDEARFRNPWNLGEIRSFGRSREDLNAELTSRARSAIDQMPVANDRIRSAATDILERFDDKDAKIARMVLASSSPEYMRAFSKMATQKEHLLTEPEKRALDQVRAMSLTDSAGGFLVPFQLDPTVIVTANGSTNQIRQIARQVVATGDVWNGVSASAVNWSWDAEATEVSDDTPTFASPSIPVYKAAGFVPISIEALEDANNVASTVAQLLAEGRDILESAAFATGSGTGMPTGIITALVGSSSIVTSAVADTLGVGDLYAVQGSLPARYRANAAWLANNLFYNRARQFDTAGGSALWAQLGDGRPANLLGRPIYEAEDLDGSITAAAENYMAVFGDFRNYVIADRIGMTVEFIPHLFHVTTNRPSGQRGWYAYYRVGADSVNDAAFRMLNVT